LHGREEEHLVGPIIGRDAKWEKALDLKMFKKVF